MCQNLFSGRFDLKVMLPGIMEYKKKHSLDVSVIKKGSSIFNLILRKEEGDRVAVLSKRDTCNFNAPCSLDDYLMTWNGDYSKSIFPYTFFKSVEELRTHSEFPSKEAFFNDLKQVRSL